MSRLQEECGRYGQDLVYLSGSLMILDRRAWRIDRDRKCDQTKISVSRESVNIGMELGT